MIRFPIPLLMTTLALSACGDGSNPFNFTTDVPDDMATYVDPGAVNQDADGAVSIEQTTGTIDIPELTLTDTEISAFSDDETSGNAVQSADMLAIGGISNGVGFAGITGTTATTAPESNATFTGNYAVTNASGTSTGPLEVIYTFGNNTLVSVDGDVSVAAIANGTTLTGSVTYAGESGALSGGFYPEGQLAAAFNGETMGGVIFAAQ
ncbi:MAG: hypothetical protein ABJO29_14080 [Yoonia sp.]|uniref:hypothetical protein n=1 Tax=Yoonia sp. TaxID=2212373 RepID=UPI003266BC88